jgi:hypothetical protein
MIGKGPVRWREVEEYALALRALLRGERSTGTTASSPCGRGG